jgi:LPXTG-motif cell wall-anchored protein
MGGLTLLKTTDSGDNHYVNGISVVTDVSGGLAPADVRGFDVCNGFVYLITGVLAPNNDLATLGLTNDGSTTQTSPPAASGSGLPATGSESLALTYAALASLIAGAGVLVLRRRSVA